MESDSEYHRRGHLYSFSLLSLTWLLFFYVEPSEYMVSVPLETRLMRIAIFSIVWLVLVGFVLHSVNKRYKKNRFSRLRKKVMAQRLSTTAHA